MRYRIVHTTNYVFSAPVFLEPHQLRFRPQATPYHTLAGYELQVFPAPGGRRQLRDGENNLIDSVWFDGLHQQLNIRAESLVDIAEHNPFDFILYPAEVLKVPFTYPDAQAPVLAPALRAEPLGRPLLDYGQEILAGQQSNTTLFLNELTRRIQADFEAIYRETGPPLPPDQTFSNRTGSCRDLSWMMIQLLRQLGLATRFVSGYNYIITEEAPAFELHAWVEVFLPGAGWVGYDPTHGVVVGTAHIPIAASTTYENTMPVIGKLRGTAHSELITDLHIDQLGE